MATSPRDPPATAAADVVAEMADVVRRRIYEGKPWASAWWRERGMVSRACAWLGRWFAHRGVAPARGRLVEIVDTVAADIFRHAAFDRPHNLALYFAACLQRHMQHRGDAYYDEAKRLRDTVASVLNAMLTMKAPPENPVPLAPVDQIAALYASLDSRRKSRAALGRRRAAAKRSQSRPSMQEELGL